jgi:tRNA-dihydrouridine synthase 3
MKSFDNKFLSDSKPEEIESKNEEKSDQQLVNKKKRYRGQNKDRRKQMNRQFVKSERNPMNKKMCLKYLSEGNCSYGEKCVHSHDLDQYLDKCKSEDISDDCYVFNRFGKCPFGITCRFGSQHLNGSQNLINFDKYNESLKQKSVTNLLSKELQFNLRKKLYDFSKSKTTINDMLKVGNDLNQLKTSSQSREVKKLDFSGKLYLAPLTTVGNLPFRRICKQFGADITCGEMSMASNLLEGSQSEWALLRRHHSENIFGLFIICL